MYCTICEVATVKLDYDPVVEVMSGVMDVTTIKEIYFPTSNRMVLTYDPNREAPHIKLCTNISPSLLDLLMATEDTIRKKVIVLKKTRL